MVLCAHCGLMSFATALTNFFRERKCSSNSLHLPLHGFTLTSLFLRIRSSESTVIIPLGAPLHRWRLLMPPPLRLNHPLPKWWSNQSLRSRSHRAVTRLPRSWEIIKQEECSAPAARLYVEQRRSSHGDLGSLHARSFRSRRQCEPESESKLWDPGVWLDLCSLFFEGCFSLGGGISGLGNSQRQEFRQ